MALTRRQKQVIDFIIGFVDENGYSPSYEEIAHALGLTSLATVHKHLSVIEAKGYLRRGVNQSRSVEIAPDYLAEHRKKGAGHAGLDVPLAGRIAAGAPVEAYANAESLSFSDFVSDKGTFALEVNGDSMIDDHIMSGDYVLIEKTNEAADGDVVVALVDGSETTLKRFYREGNGTVRLQPANSTMEPILVDAGKVNIQGRLLAVLRKYR